MNKIEQIKAEKDGLDVGADIPRYAGLGFDTIDEGDLERLKWWGVFFRRHTPGHFMMRIRIPNGITSAGALRAIGGITERYGRGFADITTRQQIQLRWIRIDDVPAILDRLREVGLLTLQTGMDNIRNVVGCPVGPAGMLLGARVGPGEWWLWNQLPVTLGNVVGGLIFTGLALHVTHRRAPARELPRATAVTLGGEMHGALSHRS